MVLSRLFRSKLVIFCVFFLGLPVFSVFTSAVSSAAEKKPFFYVLEADILGGYSKIIGGNGTVSSSDRWLVSPNLKIKDGLYWINVYNGSYDRASQVVAQEEGGRQTQSTVSHTLSSALKFNVNPAWSLRPLVFADWVFVDETKNESFGDGLYDYRDAGTGLESSWMVSQTKDEDKQWRAGFRYLGREYPNFQSLLSQFDPNGNQETNEKDLNGYKVNVGYDSNVPRGTSWGWETISFLKDYTDKRTINSNGIRTNDNRQDFLQVLSGNVSRPLTQEFRWRLDGQFAFNLSNLDFYDTHNTLSLTDDTFVKDYFDTVSFLLRPTLIYTRPIEKDKNIVLTASYAFYAQLYTGRLAQNTAGIYQNEKENDLSHTFSARASYPLTRNISWVTTCNYTIATSNQKFESFYLYSYDSWSALTGFSFKT